METIRFGLVGLGRFGRHYLRLLSELPGVSLRAVATKSGGRLGADALMLPQGCEEMADAGALFDRDDIDAVVIATPAETHAELAAAALAAGKHVLLEKPLAETLAGAEIVAAAARGSRGVFAVGHQYLFHDAVAAWKALLESGEMGAARFFESQQFSPGPVRTGVDCFTEMATHELALIDHLFDPGDIVHVSGMRSGDDAAAALIRFSSGLHASVTVSWSAAEKVRRCGMVAERGAVSFDDLRPNGKLAVRHADGRIETPAIIEREPLRNQLEAFLETIRTRKESRSGIERSLRVARWLDRCVRAMDA